ATPSASSRIGSAGNSLNSPRPAYGGAQTWTRPGACSRTASGASPVACSARGERSTSRTSAVHAASGNAAASIATSLLPRSQQSSPGSFGGSSSAVSAATRTTSAPRSARSMPATRPAGVSQASRTRMPRSGSGAATSSACAIISGLSEDDREFVVHGHESRGTPYRWTRELEVGEPLQQFLEDDPGLHASKRRAQAHVLTEAEGHVSPLRTGDVEDVGIGPDLLVPVGARIQHHDVVAGRDGRAPDLRVLSRGAREGDDRADHAQHLLDPAGNQ